jgi:hypothetical protein
MSTYYIDSLKIYTTFSSNIGSTRYLPQYFYKSESSTTNNPSYNMIPIAIQDITIPNANFPYTLPTRYIINLIGQPYYEIIDAFYGWESETDNFKIIIRNINTSTLLTRIKSTDTLIENTFKIFTSTSLTSARLELHVGTSSNNVGDILSIGYSACASIIASSYLNELFRIII